MNSKKMEEVGLMELFGFALRALPALIIFTALAGSLTYWRYTRDPAYTADGIMMLESSKSDRVLAVTEKLAGNSTAMNEDTDRLLDKYFLLFSSGEFVLQTTERFKTQGKYEIARDLFKLRGKRAKDEHELAAYMIEIVGMMKSSSDTFRFSISLPRPEQAVDALNLIMDTYPALLSDRDFKALSDAKAFLEGQIGDVEKRLLNIDDQISQRQNTAKRERINLGAKASKGAVTEDRLEQAMFATREQLDETNAMLAEARSHSKPGDSFNLSDKYSTFASESQLRRQKLIYELRLNSTQRLLKEVRQTPQPGVREDREVFDLYKRKELEYQLFTDLKKEIMRIDLQRISLHSKLRVLDRPTLSTVRTGETLKPLIIKRVLFAAILALLFVFLKEAYSPTLKSRKDLSGFGFQFLGSVPNLTMRKRFSFSRLARSFREKTKYKVIRPLASEQNSYFDMVFRNICARVINYRPDDRPAPRVVAVISATSNEGKTTIARNLARSFAKSGKRTLLVDCDLRRRELTTQMHFESEVGLTDFLKNPETSFAQPVVKQMDKNLDFLPSGPMPQDAMELISNENFHNFIEAMKHFYDVILMDTPPAIPCSEVISIANASDLVLLTTIIGNTKLAHIDELRDKLQFSLKAPMAYVLNKHDQGSAYSYYSDYSQLQPARRKPEVAA